MVAAAINHMKVGKAPGPSGIVIEMIHAAGDKMIRSLTSLINKIIEQRTIPSDWELSYIINCFKGKGYATECGKYRGSKLLDQILKVVERVIEVVIRKQHDINSMQFGFIPGRSTTDAIFILRQLHEKTLE